MSDQQRIRYTENFRKDELVDAVISLKAKNEQLQRERDELFEVSGHVGLWLKAALECKDWSWDGDQREAAESCLRELLQLRKGASES